MVFHLHSRSERNIFWSESCFYPAEITPSIHSNTWDIFERALTQKLDAKKRTYNGSFSAEQKHNLTRESHHQYVQMEMLMCSDFIQFKPAISWNTIQVPLYIYSTVSHCLSFKFYGLVYYYVNLTSGDYNKIYTVFFWWSVGIR